MELKKILIKIVWLSVISAAMVTTVGCTSLETRFDLRDNAVYPYNEAFVKGTPVEKRALVLIGFFGDEQVSEIETPGPFPDKWIMPTALTKFNDVHMIPVEVGKNFRINKLKLTRKPDSKLSYGYFPVAYIPSTQVLNIDKPGVYYFGKVIFANDRYAFDPQVDPLLVNMAQKKFPGVFQGPLQKIGF